MAESSTVPVKNGNGKVARHAEPLALFDTFATELERWWSRPFSFYPTHFPRPLRGFPESTMAWAPKMDVYEKDNSIYVKAELPGLKKEDVTVEVQGGALTVRGESKAESQVKEDEYYRSERSFGSFYRRIQLPLGVNAEQIQANLTDGVLVVQIPKPMPAKPEATKVPVN